MSHFARIAPLVGVMLLAAMAASHAQQPRGNTASSQVGIFCEWSIYVTLRAVGDLCFRDDTEINGVIHETVEKIEAFVLKNSTMTETEIEAGRKRLLANGRLLPTICQEPDDFSIRLYRNLQKMGPAAIRQRITALLAVPRKPEWEPCL